jgi:hypothetical protein
MFTTQQLFQPNNAQFLGAEGGTSNHSFRANGASRERTERNSRENARILRDVA